MDDHRAIMKFLAQSKVGVSSSLGASADHSLRIWDLVSGRELHVLRGHANGVNDAVVFSGGQRLAQYIIGSPFSVEKMRATEPGPASASGSIL